MQRHGCPDLDPGQPAAGEHTVMVWHKGQAYGQDLRDRVLNAKGSIREMVVRFGVNKSYVARARSPLRRHSKDTPQCNHVPLTLSGLEQALANPVAAVNDWTLQHR